MRCVTTHARDSDSGPSGDPSQAATAANAGASVSVLPPLDITLVAQLRSELPRLREAVPLAPYCAYRVGGPAQLLVEADSDEALVRSVTAGREAGLAVTVLGQATNVLVGDGGIPGLVVLARNADFRLHDEILTASAGAVLSTVALYVARLGWAGLEFSANIPGSVGGAVVGNAGAYGQCVADVLVDCVLSRPDGSTTRSAPAHLQLGYRSSALKASADRPPQLPETVVVSAGFRLAPGTPKKLLAAIAHDAGSRKAKHPLEYASCGSYFKNPSRDRPAAQIIEQAGLKGLTVGRAQVSERHANFLVALEGARAADIRALAAEVRRRVLESSGVELREEVVHLGVA